jgi:hypothetical protein
LGRRWLTYISIFWPTSWALIIGGYLLIAYISIITFALIVVDKLIRKNLDKIWLMLLVSFLLMITAMRYVRNPLFDSYLVFMHPFILLFTAFSVYYLLKKNILIGLILLILIVSGSLFKDYQNIIYATNNTYLEAKQIETLLIKKVPGKQFSLYNFGEDFLPPSLPVTMLLYEENKINDNGFKIGIRNSTDSSKFIFRKIYDFSGYQLFDLNSSDSGQLLGNGWKLVSPSEVYKSTEDWYNKNK